MLSYTKNIWLVWEKWKFSRQSLKIINSPNLVRYFWYTRFLLNCMVVLYLQGDSSSLQTMDDLANWKAVQHSLNVLDFSQQEQKVRPFICLPDKPHPGGSVVSVSDSWPGGCEFDPWLRRTFFLTYFRLSPLQKHVRKVVGGFEKKSCVSTGLRKPGNTCASPSAMIWP